VSESNQIPIVEKYRGVGIHADQPRHRVETVVKPAIDEVFTLDDAQALVTYAGDITRPPEARLAAEAKARALHQMAADEKRARPEIDLEYLGAQIAGLNSKTWRDPWAYCSLLDACRRGPNMPKPVPREVPLQLKRIEPR
jgi:hypothetical protein